MKNYFDQNTLAGRAEHGKRIFNGASIVLLFLCLLSVTSRMILFSQADFTTPITHYILRFYSFL